MAYDEPAILRRWDGRTKTATAWTITTREFDLCAPAANCCIYLTDHDDPNQPRTPAFKVTFDQLVVKQCQPLLKNLLLDSIPSDPDTDACHLDRPKGHRASWSVPLSSWICSLTLPPPKLASEHDALLYNVTTRNFFAWLVGASLVGYNPTSALVALKSRMDIWRAPSCDNVAALQDYARAQSYGYLAGLHLVNTTILRSTPFIPSDYTLTSSIDTSDIPTSDLSKPLQFGHSLRRRAGIIFRRKSEVVDDREAFSTRPSSAPVERSVPDSELNGLTFMSGALSEDQAPPKLAHVQSILDDASWLGSAYDAISDNGKSSDTSTATTSTDKSTRSSGLVTLSSRSTTDTQSDLPELDTTYATKSKDFAQPSSWLPNLNQSGPQVTNSSLYQSPVSIDPPRSYSSTANRHSFSGDRRRPSSRSRPPSPIMEEVIEPLKRRQPNNITGRISSLKKLSIPPLMIRKDPEPKPVDDGASVKTVKGRSQDENRSPRSATVPRTSIDSSLTICTTCNRCKKPCLPTTHVQPLNPVDGVIQPSPRAVPAPTNANTSVQSVLSEGRWLSPKIKDVPNQEELTRFPSLRRRGRSATLPSAPELPQDAGARISTYAGRLRAASQTAPATRPIMSETIPPVAASRRSLDQSPLNEQRYNPLSSHRATTTEQHYLPRTQSYNLTEKHHNPPAQISQSAALSSPIRMMPPNERRMSYESARRHPQQLQAASTPVTENRQRISLDLTRFSEPVLSVIMKSNGSKVSLALPHDESGALSLDHPILTGSTSDLVPESKDDQIVFEQLLDGLRFIDKTPQATAPRSYSRPPAKKETGVTTGFPRASSRLAETNTPKSPKRPKAPKAPKIPAIKLRRSTWAGTVRGWLAKDNDYSEAEFDNAPQTLNKGTGVQIRVLTLDSDGHFSTSMVDSPAEEAADWRS